MTKLRLKKTNNWAANQLAIPAIFRWADPTHLTEYLCKMLLGLEAARDRYIDDSHVSGAQHFFRALYPLTQYKSVRGLAC